jgi:DNA-binding transcriptional ArsR family regulator
VITYRFGSEDLLRTRFAISPLLELVGAFYALRWPERSEVHRPWARTVASVVDPRELPLLDAATPRGGGYWPVFLAPPPVTPHASVEHELERVATTPPKRVRSEIVRTYQRRRPPGAEPFVSDTRAARDALVEEMRAFWSAALAPWWPSISALLEAEVAARARRLVAGGLETALSDLHPSVGWRDSTLTVHPSGKEAADVDLAGRGLLVVPAVFCWPTVWPRTDPPWDPALVYPPTGIGNIWTARTDDADPLDALLGHGRARVLRDLERPASTQDLAGRLAASPGGVSQHLGILYRAGLVTSSRVGRRVIYSRTAKGDLLCSP